MTRRRARGPGAPRWAAGVAVVALALGPAGCAGAARDPGGDQPGAVATTGADPAGRAQLWTLAPLTGEPAASAAALARPALAVAITLEPGGPAPAGLDGADVVYEQAPPGNPHRLVALYQSRDAARIGPVGDPDPSDTRLLPVVHGVVAHSGAPKKFNDAVHATPGITDASYAAQAKAYTAENGHLFTSTAALYAVAAGASPPPNLFSYVGPGLDMVTTGRKPTGTVKVTPPGEAPVVWTDDADRKAYVRQVPAAAVTNVVVLVMPYREVTDRNRHGNTVRTAEVFGDGDCLAASNGLSAPCRWSREGANKLTLLLDTAGYPVRLAPGPTWVMLVPPGTAIEAG
jgi:DUF3048 family protein